MQIGPKIDEIGASACIASITIYYFSIDLDFYISSRPHLPRNFILMILLFLQNLSILSRSREMC